MSTMTMDGNELDDTEDGHSDGHAASTSTKVTKVSKLFLEGRHGEQLLLRSRHTTLEPSMDVPPYRSVLSDSGCLDFTLELIVDGVRCQASQWKRSGTMQSFLGFMRENAKALQIDALEDPVVLDQRSLTTSLHLDTFPAPLKQHLTSPSLLTKVALSIVITSHPAALHFESQALPILDRLLAKKLDANIDSLLFQGWQKLAGSLAYRYPLIFNRTFVQTILQENKWLDRVATSLDAILRGQSTMANADLASAQALLRSKYASLLSGTDGPQESQAEPDDWEDILQQRHQSQSHGASTDEAAVYRMSMFDLLLHAIKRRSPMTSEPESSETHEPVAQTAPQDDPPAVNHTATRRSRTRRRSVISISDDDEPESSQSQKRRIDHTDVDTPPLRPQATQSDAHGSAFAAFFDQYDFSDGDGDPFPQHFDLAGPYSTQNDASQRSDEVPSVWQTYDAASAFEDTAALRHHSYASPANPRHQSLTDMLSKAFDDDYDDSWNDELADEHADLEEQDLLDLNARMATLQQSYRMTGEEHSNFEEEQLDAVDQRMMALFGDEW